MELSLILARCWGIILVIVCISFLVNKKLYADIIKAAQTEEFMYLYGLIALIIGALSVSVFKIWAFNYRGLLTLFGWTALLKGVSAFAFPKLTMKSINCFKEKSNLLYAFFVIFLLLGIYLVYISFIH